MSAQAVGGMGDMAAVAALSAVQGTQAGVAAAHAALAQTTGGSAAPIESSSATAPGSLEIFA